MVKSSVTNTVKNIVSNPVQAVKSVAKAVVNAVTHPVRTAVNAARSVGNAVRTVYNEVRTPDSQSRYASPATSRGTGSARSGGSYSGSSGGGSYSASPMAYSPYDSNGNAYSYFNSSFDTGKVPSTDAPRIKDVDDGTLKKYCANGPKKNTSSNYILQALNSPIVEIKTSEDYTFNHTLEEFNVSEEKNGIVAAIKNFFGIKRNGTLYETNCYAFALDLTENPLTGDDFNSKRGAGNYALQPGMLSGGSYSNNFLSPGNMNGYESLIELMQSDVESLGKTMEKYDPNIHNNVKGYVIAVAIKQSDAEGNGGDYHLFRLNEDQKWESKDGATEAKIVGTNEDSIKDIATQMGYSDKIELYYIKNN